MLIGREQFRGADYAECAVLLGPDRVLAALAARDLQHRDVRIDPARQIRNQPGGFVVWVRRGVQNPRGNARLIDRLDRVRQRLREHAFGLRREQRGHHHNSSYQYRDRSHREAIYEDFRSAIHWASSNGHWRDHNARPKYTRIPAPAAPSEASIGLRPVEMKIPIHPAIATITGSG